MKKAEPITKSEAELRAFAKPEKMKGFRILIGEEIRYTYSNNSDSALARVAKTLGCKATILGKAVTQEEVLSNMMALPPDHLKDLIAKVNATSFVAGKNPTANLSRQKV